MISLYCLIGTVHADYPAASPKKEVREAGVGRTGGGEGGGEEEGEEGEAIAAGAAKGEVIQGERRRE